MITVKEYIEREVALDILCDGCCECTIENPFACEGCEQRAEVLRISAADVAPVVHGKWIEYSGDPNIITCSECDWGTSPEEKGFKFCPNCGARMDGGK